MGSAWHWVAVGPSSKPGRCSTFFEKMAFLQFWRFCHGIFVHYGSQCLLCDIWKSKKNSQNCKKFSTLRVVFWPFGPKFCHLGARNDCKFSQFVGVFSENKISCRAHSHVTNLQVSEKNLEIWKSGVSFCKQGLCTWKWLIFTWKWRVSWIFAVFDQEKSLDQFANTCN